VASEAAATPLALAAAVALEPLEPVKKTLPAKSDRARTIAHIFNTFDHLFFILCLSKFRVGEVR
jgi:hypothetical protein